MKRIWDTYDYAIIIKKKPNDGTLANDCSLTQHFLIIFERTNLWVHRSFLKALWYWQCLRSCSLNQVIQAFFFHCTHIFLMSFRISFLKMPLICHIKMCVTETRFNSNSPRTDRTWIFSLVQILYVLKENQSNE